MNAIKYNKATGEIVAFLTVQSPKHLEIHSDETFGCLAAPEVPVGSTGHMVVNGAIVARAERPSIDHEWIGGQWVLNEAKVFDRKAREVRRMRDELLEGSDWVVTKALEANEPVPAAWIEYRGALRDLSEQTGFPFNVTFPEKPQAT